MLLLWKYLNPEEIASKDPLFELVAVEKVRKDLSTVCIRCVYESVFNRNEWPFKCQFVTRRFLFASKEEAIIQINKWKHESKITTH